MKNENNTSNELAIKQVILNLIQNDLRITCLVTGLDDLGMDAVRYQPSLSNSVFNLMGFNSNECDDKLLDAYCREIEKGAVMNVVSSPPRLEETAIEIYDYLHCWKKH